MIFGFLIVLHNAAAFPPSLFPHKNLDFMEYSSFQLCIVFRSLLFCLLANVSNPCDMDYEYDWLCLYVVSKYVVVHILMGISLYEIHI